MKKVKMEKWLIGVYALVAVSYIHLTLPTKRGVAIPGVGGV
ncbi:hypothetical protein [Listeria monocytogenes]|nr:hypothetical protein [Listeria monocytogenes]